jgi:hypothetical protein
MAMDYGKILSKAWKTIWKHKILWLFGVLAGCSASGGGGGGGGRGSSSFSGSSSSNGFQDGPSFLGPQAQHNFDQFFNSLSEVQPWIWVVIAIGVLLLVVILSILALMTGTLGTTGVIKGAAMADRASEEDKPISFGAIFKGIKPYYWKVLLLTVGVNVAGLIVGLILALPIILFTVCTCFLGLFLLIPLGWFVNAMVTFTTIGIIEEDLGIFEAIGRAWNLIIKNLGEIAVMFLILGVGQFVIGLVIALPIFVSIMPMMINLIASGGGMFKTGLIITLVMFLIALPLTIFLSGVLRAYVLTSWTLTYRLLAEKSELEPEVISLPEKKK